jgi:multidrug efflux pump subunit AcrA (membrane-fusion protein)
MLQAPEGLFRKAALEHHAASDIPGELVRLLPGWNGPAYWLMFGALAVGLTFALFARLDEYVSGPVVVRATARLDLNAPTSTIVQSVRVQPGDVVAAGDVLLTFRERDEKDDLARIGRELELQLVKVLRDPQDLGARDSVARLRADQQRARDRLEDRSLTAPESGVVAEVRAREGQHLAAGDRLLSLLREGGRFTVLALLPGQAGPLLTPGQQMRLRFDRLQRKYETATVTTVGNEVMGPTEARRLIGPDLGDAFDLHGPVVAVRAELTRQELGGGERRLAYMVGLEGEALVAIRTRSLLAALVPGSDEGKRSP